MSITLDNNKSQVEEIKNILNDKNKFLGEFNGPTYKLKRSYIVGDGKQLRLSYTQLSPIEPPTASVCIVHGLADHSGAFVDIAYQLCTKGYSIHLIDLRGFGFSGGPRGCSSLHQILLDIGTLISQADPNLPLFLYGHCLGALCCLLFTILNPHVHIAGLICTSPLLAFPTDGRFTWLRLNFLKTAGKLFEDLVINSLVNPTALTKRSEYMKDIIGDRLAIPFIGLNMASSIIQGESYVKEHAGLIKRPIMIIHGKEDTVVNYSEADQFYERCGSSEKVLKIFDKGMHELQHDDENIELQNLVSDWISRKSVRSHVLGDLPTSFNVRFVKKKKMISRKRIAIIIIIFLVWHLVLIYKFKNFNWRNKIAQLKTLISKLIDRFTE